MTATSSLDDAGHGRRYIGGGPSLTIPLEEALATAPTIRIGPDRLPDEAFTGVSHPVAWAAYWYRSHAICAPYCRCWAPDASSYIRGGGGEGLAIVVFSDGLIGVYGILHSRDMPPFDWSQLGPTHTRLTFDELIVMRAQGIALCDSAETIIRFADELNEVWRAFDVGMQRSTLLKSNLRDLKDAGR